MRRMERMLVAANQWALFAMMMAMLSLVVGNVAARYVFNHSIPWAEELSQYLMVWVTWAGAGLALRQGRHVAVDMLQARLPQRLQQVTRLAIGAAILAFLLLLVVVGVRFAAFTWRDETPVMNIPMGIPYLAIPVGALLFALHFVLVLGDWLGGRHEAHDAIEAHEAPAEV